MIRDRLLREMTKEEVLEAHCLWQLERPKLTGVSTAEMYDLDLYCGEGEEFDGSEN